MNPFYRGKTHGIFATLSPSFGEGNEEEHGYTALELLVVMAIVAMVFSTAVVYFQPFAKTARTRTATSDMADLLRSARSAAINARCDCTVQLILNPDDSDFLGTQSPKQMWEDGFGDAEKKLAFQDVKPPANSVVSYYSDSSTSTLRGAPLIPSELPTGESEVFIRWFTPLPKSVNWLDNDDKEVSGLRITFKKDGSIWTENEDSKIKDLPKNAIKVVEASTFEASDETQVLKYLVLVPNTGGVRVMNKTEFDEYVSET